MTASSGTAAAFEVDADTDLCEAEAAQSLVEDSPPQISLMAAAQIEVLLAQVRPPSPALCLTNLRDKGTDPRCRAEAPGHAPSRSPLPPGDSTDLVTPAPNNVAGTNASKVLHARAPAVVLCAGYALDLDRPPQS